MLDEDITAQDGTDVSFSRKCFILMYLSSVGLAVLCHIATTLQSRDQILRRERRQGNIYFPCSADHDQGWQPYPVDPYTCYMCDHTYVCMCNHTAYRIGYNIDINQEYRNASLGTSTVYMFHASPVTNECDLVRKSGIVESFQ